jgi:hypothetical protein
MAKIMKDKSSLYDERNCYKADGIIAYKIEDIHVELMLLRRRVGTIAPAIQKRVSIITKPRLVCLQ